MASGYSDDEIRVIAQWLRDGLSASGIAGRLSVRRGRAVSRNAIIGIVARNKVLAGIGFERKAGRPRSKISAGPMAAQPKGSARIPDQARRVAVARTHQFDSVPQPVVPVAHASAPLPLTPSFPKPAPIPFLDAVNRGLCLVFADDPMAPAGPDMPVCGAPRQTVSRKPYCDACLRREAA